METAFWLSIALIVYTYIGYAVLLCVAILVKRLFSSTQKYHTAGFTPALTVVVTAYNEFNYIEKKIQNTFSLNYPESLLEIIFITDGSDDGTPEAIAKYPRIKLMHQAARNGKAAAINRAMREVSSSIVVFTDANTMLNRDALLHIGKWYADEKTGAVAGEKRVDIAGVADATAGEGWYWKYESFIKRCESEMYSVAGAAGELFSIRAGLYEPVPADTVLDDLVISLGIALKGYAIRYEPKAYAIEKTSPTVAEETKRKLRIAAGDIQAMLRLPFFRMLLSKPVLWFEYVSHRILRWVITPYALMVAGILNVAIFLGGNHSTLISVILYAQLFFYVLALAGWLLRKQELRAGIFFVPYYFCLMNYGIIAGTLRYVLKGQPVNWEKAARR